MYGTQDNTHTHTHTHTSAHNWLKGKENAGVCMCVCGRKCIMYL